MLACHEAALAHQIQDKLLYVLFLGGWGKTYFYFKCTTIDYVIMPLIYVNCKSV